MFVRRKRHGTSWQKSCWPLFLFVFSADLLWWDHKNCITIPGGSRAYVCVWAPVCVHGYNLLKQTSEFSVVFVEMWHFSHPPFSVCLCVSWAICILFLDHAPFSVFHFFPCLSLPSHQYQCHMTVAVRRPELGAVTHSQQQKHINTTWRAAIRQPPRLHITAQTTLHRQDKALHFQHCTVPDCQLLSS